MYICTFRWPNLAQFRSLFRCLSKEKKNAISLVDNLSICFANLTSYNSYSNHEEYLAQLESDTKRTGDRTKRLTAGNRVVEHVNSLALTWNFFINRKLDSRKTILFVLMLGFNDFYC